MNSRLSQKPTSKSVLRTSLKLRILIGVSAMLILAGIITFIVIYTGSTKHSHAETAGIDYTFTGSSSTAWATAANWDLGSIPGSTANVIIPLGKTCVCGTANRTCVNLTVNGTLNINSSTNTLSASGTLSGSGSITLTGAMSVTGGGTFSGTITNNKTLTFVSPFTMNGTLVNTGTITTGALAFGSTGIYNHSKDGGSIPTATWNANSTCLISGITGAAGVGSLTGLTQTFGNFTWNCPSETADIGNLGPMTIAGTFSLQSSGTQTFYLADGTSTVSTYSQTGGTIRLGGQIGHNRVLNVNSNFNMSGGTIEMSRYTGTGTSGDGKLNVTGNFSLSGGTIQNTDLGTSAIDIAGNLVLSGGILDLTGGTSLNVAGNWTKTGGTFTQSNGNVIFDGANEQIIGGSSSLAFINVTINNTSATKKVVLNKDVTINGTLTFIDGIIDALTNYTSTPLLIFSTTGIISTSSAPDDTCHVFGTVRKITTSTTQFTFPIGSSSYYRPLSVTPSTNSSTTWTAQYINSTPPNNLNLLAGVNHISSGEYWTLTRSEDGTPAKAKIGLSWNKFSGVSVLSDLIVAHNNGTAWESCASGGKFTTTGDTLNGKIQTTAYWNSFSSFTLGSKTKNNTLPVEMLSFDATSSDGKVLLTWVTASETNNDYFSVERSIDGVTYTSIGTVKGAGNSNSNITYQFTDANPDAGANYYRLKQVDFNGAYEYSKLIAVNMSLSGGVIGTVTAGPNPFKDNININYTSSSAGIVDVKLYDMSGKEVKSMKAEAANGLNTYSLNDNSDLPAGIYMLGIISENKMTSLVKMIKSN